jgi:hypothetical protein
MVTDHRSTEERRFVFVLASCFLGCGCGLELEVAPAGHQASQPASRGAKRHARRKNPEKSLPGEHEEREGANEAR